MVSRNEETLKSKDQTAAPMYYVREYFAGMDRNGNGRRALALVGIDAKSAHVVDFVKVGDGSGYNAARCWPSFGVLPVDPTRIVCTPGYMRDMLKDYRDAKNICEANAARLTD